MKVITGTREFCIEEPTVVTIGKFDGRHKGHQKLLKEMLRQKECHGWKTAVFTFDMAPMGVVSGKRATVITTNEERRNNMRAMGMDYLVEYPFSREVAAMSPEDFVTEVLVKQMHAKAVVAGPDCSFGHKGAGNAELLRKLGPEYGFETIIIEKKQDDQPWQTFFDTGGCFLMQIFFSSQTSQFCVVLTHFIIDCFYDILSSQNTDQFSSFGQNWQRIFGVIFDRFDAVFNFFMICYIWIRSTDDVFQFIVFSGDDQILQINGAVKFIGIIYYVNCGNIVIFACLFY